MDKTFTTGLSPEGKQAKLASLVGKPYNRPSGEGNAPLLPPAAASPPEGEILAALYNELLKLALRDAESRLPPPGCTANMICRSDSDAQIIVSRFTFRWKSP